MTVIDTPTEAASFDTPTEALAALQRLLCTPPPDEPRPFGAPRGLLADLDSPAGGVF